MTVVITLAYPPNVGDYSDNQYYSGRHWSNRDRDAKYWHERMRYEAPWNRPSLKSPVRITYFWDDRLDLSNHSMMAKMIEDGLKGRLFKDDSRKHVCEIRHRWHREGNIKIVIEEVDDDKR